MGVTGEPPPTLRERPWLRTDRMAGPASVRMRRGQGCWVADAPSCRSAWFAHRLETDEPPWRLGAERWLRRWRDHHAGKGVEVAFVCWEGRQAWPGEEPPGVRVGRLVALRLGTLRPAPVPAGVRLAPLTGAAGDDWEALTELLGSIRGSDEAGSRRQLDWMHEDRRRRVQAGAALQWGAYAGGQLVAACGLCWDEREGRHQDVVTAEGWRRRGIASALVSRVAQLFTARRRPAPAAGADLWIVAEPGSSAERIYRRLGFAPASEGIEMSAPAPRTEAEIRALTDALEDGSLPPERWGHREHVTVATQLLLDHELRLGPALERLRAGLRAHQRRLGIETTRERGYHETLTRGWLELVRSSLARRRAERGAESLQDAALGASLQLADKRLLLRHWTRERLMSWEARRAWCPPDRAPLPGC